MPGHDFQEILPPEVGSKSCWEKLQGGKCVVRKLGGGGGGSGGGDGGGDGGRPKGHGALTTINGAESLFGGRSSQ